MFLQSRILLVIVLGSLLLVASHPTGKAALAPLFEWGRRMLKVETIPTSPVETVPASPPLILPALGTPPTSTRLAFVLPFTRGCHPVTQGNNGKFSHHERSNRYAWDFSMPMGSVVSASAAGRVVAPQLVRSSASSVLLDHGNGLYTLYAHLSRITVQPGQRVQPGQQLALSGKDADSQPHLHYSVVTLFPQLTSVPSRLVNQQVERDGIPRARKTYCARHTSELSNFTDTALGAHVFAAQGIQLRTAPPAHALVRGQLYHLEGTSVPLSPVVYEVRSATGVLLERHSTASNLQGRFSFNVRVQKGQAGEMVRQVLYCDPRRMGSARTAILI